MDQITIRPAVELDLPQLLDIYNDIILNTTAVWHEAPHTLDMRKAWFEERSLQGFPILVAEQGEQILGFTTVGPFRPWIGYRFTVENSVYVAPEARGKGVGKALLPPLIEACRQLKLHAIVAGIESENSASIALHQKFGFEEVARFREVGFKFNRWLDLTFMELLLHDSTENTNGNTNH